MFANSVITVSKDDAFDFARRAALEEDLFLSTSSDASLAATNKKLPDLPKDPRILTFSYNTGKDIYRLMDCLDKKPSLYQFFMSPVL